MTTPCIDKHLQPSYPEPDAWSHARPILLLVLGILICSFCVATIVFLIRRRKMYPLPERNATVLVIWSVTSLVGTLMTTASGLAYPDGSPCPQEVLLSWIFFPYVFGAFLRGWVFLFRIEIQSHLTERAWRQYRQGVLLVRGIRNSQHLLCQPPQLDPAHLPGYWCITHRKWVQPWRVACGVCGIAIVVLFVAVYTVAIHDADIDTVNAARAQLGMNALPYTISFSPTGFVHAPLCMTILKCIKCRVYLGIVVPLFVFVAGVVWRIRVHAKLVMQRAKEQAEFAILCPPDVMASASASASASAAASVASSSSSPPSLSSSPSLSHDSIHIDLDELHAVMHEFRLALVASILGQCASLATTSFFKAAASSTGCLTLFALAWFTGLGAVRQSYRVSRRQHALQQGFLSKRPGNIAAVSQQPAPRHVNSACLQRIRYVLHHEHTYPILLQFLRGEFSSENALFYHEAKRFAYFSKVLETCMGAAWTNTTAAAAAAAAVIVEGESDEHEADERILLRQFERDLHFGPQGWALPIAPLSIDDMHTYVAYARRWAMQLFTDYVQANSIYQVNVSARISRQAAERYKLLETSLQAEHTPLPWRLSAMYVDAEKEILALLKNDSFTRFVITREFEHMARDHLIFPHD
jgi:hypothetical protein